VTCAACKVMMLRVARLLEGLSEVELPEPMRHEIRQVKFMLAFTGYHIANQELSELPSGRDHYKEGS